MKLKLLAATMAVGLSIIGHTSGASATLIGDTVTIGHYVPDMATPCNNSCSIVGALNTVFNTVVQAGNADAVTTGIDNLSYTVDVGANGFTVDFNRDEGFSNNMTFNGLIVSDLDWVGMPGSITGITVNGTPAGYNIADISFTADSVSINLGVAGPQNLFHPGDRFDITFITTHASVPEPGTLALFGLGLAGLGFARRRKSS